MRTLLVLVIVIGVPIWLYFFLHRGLSTRTEPSRPEVYVATLLREWAIPAKYKELRNPVNCTDEALSDARTHWADHCATCHANNGDGDTMLGKTMYPRPPDIRQSATQRQSDGELYYTIKNGIRLSGMPAFGESLNDQQLWQVSLMLSQSDKLPASVVKKLNP